MAPEIRETAVQPAAAAGGPAFGRPNQLSVEVAAYVRDLILAGHAKAPEPLNIDRLARELQVSATPVREALLSLRGEGFVTFEPRRGFRVAPLSVDDIRDLYWAQAELAAELARRACGRTTAELVGELRRIQAEMSEAAAAGEHEDVERLNHQFHRLINRAALAPKLTWLLDATTRYAPRRFFASIPGWMEASIGDHAAVIDGIDRRDADATADAMRRHLTHAGELLAANLERQTGRSRSFSA